MQAFFEFGGNLFAFPKINKTIQAPIDQKPGDQGVEVDHGVLATYYIMDAALDVITINVYSN